MRSEQRFDPQRNSSQSSATDRLTNERDQLPRLSRHNASRGLADSNPEVIVQLAHTPSSLEEVPAKTSEDDLRVLQLLTEFKGSSLTLSRSDFQNNTIETPQEQPKPTVNLIEDSSDVAFVSNQSLTQASEDEHSIERPPVEIAKVT